MQPMWELNIIYIYRAVRTEICKAKHGGLKDTLADDLLAPPLKVSWTSSFLYFYISSLSLFSIFKKQKLIKSSITYYLVCLIKPC